MLEIIVGLNLNKVNEYTHKPIGIMFILEASLKN
jgi:hypothetical protein